MTNRVALAILVLAFGSGNAEMVEEGVTAFSADESVELLQLRGSDEVAEEEATEMNTAEEEEEAEEILDDDEYAQLEKMMQHEGIDEKTTDDQELSYPQPYLAKDGSEDKAAKYCKKHCQKKGRPCSGDKDFYMGIRSSNMRVSCGEACMMRARGMHKHEILKGPCKSRKKPWVEVKAKGKTWFYQTCKACYDVNQEYVKKKFGSDLSKALQQVGACRDGALSNPPGCPKIAAPR